MTHRNRELGLAGSLKSELPLRQCQGSCNAPRLPEGGLHVSPTKWVCSGCSARLLRRLR